MLVTPLCNAICLYNPCLSKLNLPMAFALSLFIEMLFVSMESLGYSYIIYLDYCLASYIVHLHSLLYVHTVLK